MVPPRRVSNAQPLCCAATTPHRPGAARPAIGVNVRALAKGAGFGGVGHDKLKVS
jgi:hypothetical protein